MEQNDKRLAVLIDAENISTRYIKFILDEIGTAVQLCAGQEFD